MTETQLHSCTSISTPALSSTRIIYGETSPRRSTEELYLRLLSQQDAEGRQDSSFPIVGNPIFSSQALVLIMDGSRK